MMSRITPCLWFDRDAEDAAKLYTSIFPNSRVGAISHYGDGAPLPKGTVLTVAFALDGLDYLKDRYGLSWQVVPTRFVELMREGEPAGVGRMMQALMGMVKLDVAALERAYAGQ